MPFLCDPIYWQESTKNGKPVYSCKVCADGRLREQNNANRHEATDKHKQALRVFVPEPETLASEIHGTPTPSYKPSHRGIISDGLRALLVSGSSNPHQSLYPPSQNPAYAEPNFQDTLLPESVSPVTGLNWHLQEAFGDNVIDESPYTGLRETVFDETLAFLNGSGSESDSTTVEDLEEGNDSDANENRSSKRQKTQHASSRDWYPWEDRITCSLDVLMHLPRSVFSRKQLELFLWILRMNNIQEVPSPKQLKNMDKMLQNILAQILAQLSTRSVQEMCNPLVRPHLFFYPEDSAKHLSECRQGSHWLHEMPPEKTTPMIRRGRNDDYYIFEPVMLVSHIFCLPIRWFTRQGKFYARAWKLEVQHQLYHETAGSGDGWVVREDQEFEICEDELFKNFTKLQADHSIYGVPHPSRILGIRPKLGLVESLQPWRYTNPIVGNRWRALAQGHRALSMPLFVYCDDTSGNMSKKWNEHNSFLFTLAGLERKEIAREYNIHFLCTSNTAPPLEMLDGVVQQIEEAQRDGIWAWDYLAKEPVLIFPVVLALLGDNPMHSEFACHIGLRGKYFCRTCWVKGTDAQEVDDIFSASLSAAPPAAAPPFSADPGSTPGSPCASPAPSSGGSQLGDNSDMEQGSTIAAVKHLIKERTGKYKEGMTAMLRRVSEFVKVGQPRSKAETQHILQSYFELAKQAGGQSKVKKLQTEKGIKDTVQEFYLAKLFMSYKGLHRADEKQKALDDVIKGLPSDITSAVWRLTGLDPHQDTPVEVLHVVLLGFIKYFWRDLIQNQLNDTQKKTLIARLSSFNVDGLGISPLSGKTLVKYAGSLTGRDFRVISQVAPFVIYDLVSNNVYEAWLSLSKLVPLIWQPCIEDIDGYSRSIESEIQSFLLKTARWTCRWFNKSKFHIILHLPEHIRRFGPAMLFATEGFESFNAVIRAKSIHSNRRAPSRDIAMQFAQGNRVRHLLSGGSFIPNKTGHDGSMPTLNPVQMQASSWCSVGPLVSQLVIRDPIVRHYLGLSNDQTRLWGHCKRSKETPRLLSQMQTARYIPQTVSPSPDQLYVACPEVYLLNGDKCRPGETVIIKSAAQSLAPAKVHEIIQRVGSEKYLNNEPDAVLVQILDSSLVADKYDMPRLLPTSEWRLMAMPDICCTVNIQHNCYQHGCTIHGQRAVFQEREAVSLTEAMTEHLGDLKDNVLNTSQMRDGIHLQNFRQPSQALNAELIIQESVAREINQRKDKGTATITSSLRGQCASIRKGPRAISSSSRGRVQPGELILDFRAAT